MVRTRTAVPGIEQEDKKEDSLGYDEKGDKDDSVGHDEGSNVKQQIRPVGKEQERKKNNNCDEQEE